MTVNFEAVGRDQKTWQIVTDSLSDHTLIAAIKDRGALMSNIIDFHWNDSGDVAMITVGPIQRIVGKLLVTGGFKV